MAKPKAKAKEKFECRGCGRSLTIDNFSSKYGDSWSCIDCNLERIISESTPEIRIVDGVYEEF